MDAALIQKVSKHYEKRNAPALRSGDVVRVHQKVKEGNKERIQIFEGIVIRARGGRGMDGTFTVRRMSGGIGIERTFPLHLPSVTKVEKVRTIELRQSRPYFLRDLTAKQIQKKTRKTELAEFITWEDSAAAEEEEKIKAAQEAEAKAREEAQAKEEAEAEAKVAAAKAAHEEAKKAE